VSFRRAALGSGALAALALALTGCGGSPATITVGAARPAVAALAADTAVRLPVGPGPVSARLSRDGYRIHVTFAPNRVTAPNRVLVTLGDGSGPVEGARVRLEAAMLEMDMGVATYSLAPAGNGYRTSTPAWQMRGRWGLGLTIVPPGHAPIHVVLDDRLT